MSEQFYTGDTCMHFNMLNVGLCHSFFLPYPFYTSIKQARNTFSLRKVGGSRIAGNWWDVGLPGIGGM